MTNVSLIPKFTSQSDKEYEAAVIARIGKKRYYQNKGRAALRVKDKTAEAWFEFEVVRQRKREVKLKTERLQMIKELAEL